MNEHESVNAQLFHHNLKVSDTLVMIGVFNPFMPWRSI